MRMTKEHGWIVVNVVPKAIKIAKRIRAEHDRRFGPGKAVYCRDNDKRWMGHLGEVYFPRWMEHEEVECERVGDPLSCLDFRVAGVGIDVKTSTIERPATAGFGADLNVKQAHAGSPWFFFCAYHEAKGELTMAGGISRADFFERATLYREGDVVRTGFTVKPGCDFYRATFGDLTRPRDWLNAILAK